MPRSVNQKRGQTSQGQGKIVCKHDLILIQSRLHEDKRRSSGLCLLSKQREEGDVKKKLTVIDTKRNGKHRPSGTSMLCFQDAFLLLFETECSRAEKRAPGRRLITAALVASQSEICARARF